MSRLHWSGGDSIRQYFVFPKFVIDYISSPKPGKLKIFLKLVQSCKILYERNPILIACSLDDSGRLCSEKSCQRYRRKPCCVRIDIDNLSESSICLTNGIYIHSSYNLQKHYFSNLTSKIFHCEIEALVLCDIDLRIRDLLKLSKYVTKCDLTRVNMFCEDETQARLATIFQCFPTVTDFTCDKPGFVTQRMMQELSYIKNQWDHNLLKFYLLNINGSLEISDMKTFIEENPNTMMQFTFEKEFLPGYTQELQEFSKWIISRKSDKVFLSFPLQDPEYKMIRVVGDEFLDLITPSSLGLNNF